MKHSGCWPVGFSRIPSFDRLAPSACSTVITVNSGSLLRTLQRVTLLAGESSLVRLRVTAGTRLELRSQTAEIGDVAEELPVDKIEVQGLSICFNGSCMRDILQAAADAAVQLSFAGPLKPIIIRLTDNRDALYILTPIRAHGQRYLNPTGS
ncbi:hypothetical protein ACFPYJ_01705 [Paenibacillus solisilvae]|uniref:DNA polymerase III beta sliding clamp C-terminal domain-containing protein n=1 Tax=Paenibacillus solisilvae TaxID=2486751 RepID=A0ABW0VPN8_9BACL